MKVNVVMLVKDRAKLTAQALRTLYWSTDKELFNLTIIQDEGTALYKWTALEYENLAVLSIHKSKGITGQARNLGVYWAEKYWGRGDWLYLSDNDMYFTPGWLEKLIETFGSLEVHARLRLLGGWNHPFLQPKQNDLHWRNLDIHVKSHDAVTGASQLMRWDVWDQYGPLDAHAVGVGQSEDWAMCQKIIQKGGKVGSMYPRVVLNCGVTNTFGKPSPGADVMEKELIEAKKQYADLYWE